MAEGQFKKLAEEYGKLAEFAVKNRGYLESVYAELESVIGFLELKYPETLQEYLNLRYGTSQPPTDKKEEN